jgi:aryl-alcohol dehydrogenase
MDGNIASGDWIRPLTTQAAIVAELDAPFLLRDISLSAPRADEVIVELEASGMCHADLSARSGGLPFPLPGVMGHEGVGRIVEIGGAVGDLAVGDRVVVSFSWCGHCQACLRATPAYCEDWPRLNLFGGSRADGSATLTCDDATLNGHFFGQSSFACHIVTTARATVKVPEDLPASILAPMGCGIQTGVSAATTVLCPRPGDRVAVFGAGAVGLSAIMGLRLTGAAQIIAVDVHPARLELARELGATDLVNARNGDTGEQIAQLTGKAGLAGAIETSGNLGALGAAFAALAAAGTCVVIGAPNAADTLAVNVVGMVARGTRLIGTNQGNANPRVFIPQLIELYRRGRLPIGKLVTDFAFADINKAAEASLNGSVIKPVLHMG